MASYLYKSGQGYWVRMMSGIAVGLLVLMGAVWIWDLLAGIRIEGVESVWVSMTGAVVFTAIIGGIGFLFIGRRPKIVDFMIATEGEMKKVNWSTRKEIMGSTWVVIGLTLFTAVFIFVIDYVFAAFFQLINVLEKA